MKYSPADIVKEFIENVRSGVDTSKANELMCDLVVSHNIRSEEPNGEIKYQRTPQQFVDHVQEMKDEFGDFKLEIKELFGDDSKAFVSFKQYVDLENGKQKVEYINSIYRVENDKICEYWLTLDRKGVELQGN